MKKILSIDKLASELKKQKKKRKNNCTQPWCF